MRQTLYISENIAIRNNIFEKKGETVFGHKHRHHHTSYVPVGSVHVTARYDDGRENKLGIFNAGDHFVVRAGVEHEIVNLADFSVVDCIYPHYNEKGEIVEVYQGNYLATT